MAVQRWMWIAWPSFLVAGVLEMLVFAVVDPEHIQWFGQPVELSRQAVYTLAFFCVLGWLHGVQCIDDAVVAVSI